MVLGVGLESLVASQCLGIGEARHCTDCTFTEKLFVSRRSNSCPAQKFRPRVYRSWMTFKTEPLLMRVFSTLPPARLPVFPPPPFFLPFSLNRLLLADTLFNPPLVLPHNRHARAGLFFLGILFPLADAISAIPSPTKPHIMEHYHCSYGILAIDEKWDHPFRLAPSEPRNCSRHFELTRFLILLI